MCEDNLSERCPSKSAIARRQWKLPAAGCRLKKKSFGRQYRLIWQVILAPKAELLRVSQSRLCPEREAFIRFERVVIHIFFLGFLKGLSRYVLGVVDWF